LAVGGVGFAAGMTWVYVAAFHFFIRKRLSAFFANEILTLAGFPFHIVAKSPNIQMPFITVQHKGVNTFFIGNIIVLH
jgi:hypothetical protein